METFIPKDGDRFSVKENKMTFLYIFIMITCLIIGYILSYSIYVAIALLIAILILLFAIKSPVMTLFCLVIISPFSMNTFLNENLMNIPGTKPIQLVFLLVLMASLINYHKSQKIPKKVFYYAFAIMFIFTISVLRSLKHLNIYNQYLIEYTLKQGNLSANKYLLAHLFKPLIYIIPFFIIIKFFKRKEDLKNMMSVIYFTLIAISLHIIYIYVVELKMTMDIRKAEIMYDNIYGLHRNDLATFFIIGLPIGFGKYLMNKKPHHIFFNFIIIIAIGFLFSRTAYVLSLLSIILYIIISKRFKIIPLVIITMLILISLLGSVVMERAKFGFDSKDIDKISAGRVDRIWLPIIEEFTKYPKKLFLGNGRYAILASEASTEYVFLTDVNHPHNMYLELILDAGLVGLVVFLGFYFNIIKKSFKCMENIKDDHYKEYLCVTLVSIICFLISGLTGRSLFPKYDNIFIWTMLGCNIFIIYNYAVNEKNNKIIPKNNNNKNLFNV